MRQMRRAGLVVAEIHSALRAAVAPGVSLRDLDEVCASVIRSCGAESNFLGYHGYPATVCISVNDVVVHGIPGRQKLREGDLVSFDCGAWVAQGRTQWHGDAAFSVIVGQEWVPDSVFAAHLGASPSAPLSAATSGDEGGAGASSPRLARRRELSVITRAAMWEAVASVQGARRASAVGRAVEAVVARAASTFGWEAGIVEEFTGHGIGTQMHQEPEILNYLAVGMSPKIRPGMVVAIEPILTSGSIESGTDPDGWTVRTVYGSDAAHWEHTVAILEEGISVLTAPDAGAACLAPFGITPVNLD